MPEWPRSDQKTMTPIQKGEILHLDSIGKTKKQIAGITGRSMAWIEDVIAALAGTKAKEDLIASYLKGEKSDKAKKTDKGEKNGQMPEG